MDYIRYEQIAIGVALILYGSSLSSGTLREIRLQGFIPMSGGLMQSGGACLPATLMAIRHVNERAGLLDGYNITYTWADSQTLRPTLSGHMLRPKSICFLLLFGVHISVQLREIRLQGFLPMTGTGWPGGQACLPATLMAVRHVNERAGLLDGFNVTYTWTDTECNAGEATFQLFESLSRQPTKHMLLGSACSVASQPQAEVSHLFNLTQISYLSTSPALSNKTRYPNFFQLDIADHSINPAKIALMREFNWTRVATINQAIEYHSLVIDDFVRTVAEADDITIISQELFEDDPSRRVENMKKLDAKIILVQMYEDNARMMLCSAYKLGLFGPKMVLIFNNWYSTDFWRPRNDVPCTENEMNQAIEGAFLMGSFATNPVSERGVAGITISEFEHLYKQEDDYDPAYDSFYLCAPFSYDCVWIAALALNCTESYLRATGHPKYLDEFTYQDSDINDITVSCMNNMSLLGVTGYIMYNGGAAPVNKNIKIERIQDSKLVFVGAYIMDENVRRFEWNKDALKWKNGHIPYDSTHVVYEEITIPKWLYVTVASGAGLGLLTVAACFVFNIVLREHRVIKLSSPIINNIALLGCALVYSTVYLTTALIQTAIVCKMKTFCFSIGFSIAVGSYFFKTWRIYHIFIDRKERGYFGTRKSRWKKFRSQQSKNETAQDVQQSHPNNLPKAQTKINDSHLIGLISGFTGGITLILIIWEYMSPQLLLTKEIGNEVNASDDDTEIRLFVHFCYSTYGDYFSWAIYIILGGMLVFGAFLAWETRNLKVGTHTDSHEAGMCLYNTMVISVFGLTVSLLLEDEVLIAFGVTSGCIILGTTLNLAILFLPKVIAIHQGMSSVHPIEDDINMEADISTATTSVRNSRRKKVSDTDMSFTTAEPM